MPPSQSPTAVGEETIVIVDTGANVESDGVGSDTEWVVPVVLVCLLLALPCYVSLRFGPHRFGLWWRYHTSHSNVAFEWRYVPVELRKLMAQDLYPYLRPVTAADPLGAAGGSRSATVDLKPVYSAAALTAQRCVHDVASERI